LSGDESIIWFGNHNIYYYASHINYYMELEYKEKLSQRPKEWISVGASIRRNEIDLFNKQLDNRDAILSKICAVC
jgi:hypothetical protein